MVERSKPSAGGAKNLPSGKGSKDDYECPICLTFCAQPVVTPCKHFFCLSCSKQINKSGLTCPLCREQFDKHFIPAVDHDLQEKIAQMFATDFEEAKTDLIKAGEWRGNQIPIRFAFGNTHEEVKNPKAANSDSTKKNSHRWTMFMCLNNDHAQTQKYIKKVTYHLHPTFKPSVIEVTKAPFLIARVGWGYFDIEIDVEFQDWTKMGKHKFVHELCFEGKGKTQSFDMDIDESNKDGATVNELTKLMKDLQIKK